MSRGNSAQDVTDNVQMPPPTSAISVDMQSQLNEVLSSSIEAVKAELLEETSQSSTLMANSPDSRPNSSSTSYSQSSADSKSVLSPPIKDIFTQNLNTMNAAVAALQSNDVKNIQLMVTFQGQNQCLSSPDAMVSNELAEIKREIIRRNSSSQDGTYMQQLAHRSQLPVANMIVDTSPSSTHMFNPIQMQPSVQQMNTYAEIPMISGGGMPTISQDVIMQDTSTLAHLTGTCVTQQQINAVNSRTAETILNTNIAPSLMCPNIANPSTILSSTVLSEPTALLPHSLPPTQTVVPETSNITAATVNAGTLVPPSTMQTQSSDAALNIGRNTSPVAVKKMILNAAADILTSPNPTLETRSTIQALMEINTDAILNQDPTVVSQNQQQQQQSQLQQQHQQQQPQQSSPDRGTITTHTLITNNSMCNGGTGHVVENIYDQNSNASQMSVGSGGVLNNVSPDSLSAPPLRVNNIGNSAVHNLMNVSRHELLTPSQMNELNNTIR